MPNNEKVYRKPRYYHAAFPEGYPCETKMIKKCIEEYISHDVNRVLEPACGTGRLLVDIADMGFEVTGYDLSDEMVAYSTQRVEKSGAKDKVTVLKGDMITAAFEEQFDLAFNAINSLRYLMSDKDYVQHFRNTAASLKTGGVYLVHLSMAQKQWEGKDDCSWEANVDGIRGSVKWGCTGVDLKAGVSHEYFEIDADDNGTHVAFRDDHVCRLLTFDDFKRLVDESECFTLEAIYNEELELVDPSAEITGEMGNHFFVLRATKLSS
jgi:SAM-dependent methyltransferase